MAISPCPCMPLQRGTMVLAIIDAVLSMLSLGLLILALVGILVLDEEDTKWTNSERDVGVAVVIISAVICILQVLLAFRLYYGARNRDQRNCRIWIIITTIVVIINIVNIILNSTASEFNGTSFGGTIISIVYKFYEMLVVYAFLGELRRDKDIRVVTVHPPVTQPYNPSGPGPIFVTTNLPPAYPTQQQFSHTTPVQSYPMQQFNPAAPMQPQPYPAPVHHVTTTRIS